MQAIDLLLNRFSTPQLTEPAPSSAQLEQIIKAGCKVPDHGGLRPWHFTVATGTGLQRLSDVFVNVGKTCGADEAKLAKLAKMPFRAPLIIIVSTRSVEHEKVPFQEQVIAAGCAAHAMQMACVALGYGAMWRTGDLSYDPLVKEALNIASKDEIVGFLYIGSAKKEVPAKPQKPIDCHISYFL